MIGFIKKHFREILLILTALICVAMIAVGIMMLSEYNANLEEQAGVRGLLYTTDAAESVKKKVSDYERLAASMAESVVAQNPENLDSFLSILGRLRSDKRFANLKFSRYVKDGKEYSNSGSEYNLVLEDRAIKNHLSDREIICTGVVTDREHSLAVIAFIVPLTDFEYADNLIFFFQEHIIEAEELTGLNEEYLESSKLTVVTSNDGEIIRILFQEGNEYILHQNIYEALREEVMDDSVLDGLRKLVETGQAGTFPIQIDGREVVISLVSIGRSDASLSVIGIYDAQTIYSGGYSTISVVLGMLSVFLVILLIMTIVSIVSYHRTNKKLLTMNDTDPRLGCGTRVKFERQATEILEQHKGTSFMIVVFCTKHYDYFTNEIGYDNVTDLLKNTENIIKSQLRADEIYGYLSHGQFVALFHYRDMADIKMRFSMIHQIARKYTKNIPAGYNVDLYGGFYETDLKFSSTVNEMIDFASSVTDPINVDPEFGTFHRYTEEAHQERTTAGFIEVHQEAALQNNEFRVFYQPKYNIGGNRPDGAEALVRWYDAKKDEHVTPGVFLPLFEQNGFVTKLDRYVYEQVLKYISEALERHERVYPVSVNVSRLTASQPDFVDFYVNLKRKYRVADGFIMIEFTESIAYENYDSLRDIIDRLHKNGFKCSIDDFGSGYSSYNILKELPMDEIKLDRFFIKDGTSPDRDAKVLTSIIRLAKDLKMKVTQEGVETEDQLKKLKALGCEVVQGYYYSKPLSRADYITFLTSSRIRLDPDN